MDLTLCRVLADALAFRSSDTLTGFVISASSPRCQTSASKTPCSVFGISCGLQLEQRSVSALTTVIA